MEEILYETGFSLCERSNYIISNYNNTNMWETLKSQLLGIASTIALDASLARQVCRKQSEF